MQSSREITKWMKLSLFHNFIPLHIIHYSLSHYFPMHSSALLMLSSSSFPTYYIDLICGDLMLLLLNLILADGMCMWRECVCVCVCLNAKNECTIIVIFICCSYWRCIRPQKKKWVRMMRITTAHRYMNLLLLAGWLYFKSSFLCTLQFLSTYTSLNYTYMYEFVIDSTRLLYHLNAPWRGGVWNYEKFLRTRRRCTHTFSIEAFVCIYHNTLAIISRKKLLFLP